MSLELPEARELISGAVAFASYPFAERITYATA